MQTNVIRNSVLIAILLIGYQNCSKVAVSDNSSDPSQLLSPGGVGGFHDPAQTPVIFDGRSDVNGIDGGHFDLDTSTKIYPASQGTTHHHVHEYDKKYQTTTIDFFNLIDAKFNNIQNTIPAGKRFVLNVVNASLSPGGVLEINGSSANVTKFQRGPIYQIGSASTSGTLPLSSLRLGFSLDVLSRQGLVPTETSCVRANDSGAKGEYRNGALTIQALDADHYSIDSATGAASSGLLWEATVFWHWDGGCY